MDSNDDRRRHRRFTLRVRISVQVAGRGSCEGYLMDVSEGGAYVTSSVWVVEGTNAYLRFEVLDHHAEATGVVARLMPMSLGEQGIAVELGFANDAFLNFLRNLEAVGEANRPEYLANVTNLRLEIG